MSNDETEKNPLPTEETGTEPKAQPVNDVIAAAITNMQQDTNGLLKNTIESFKSLTAFYDSNAIQKITESFAGILSMADTLRQIEPPKIPAIMDFVVWLNDTYKTITADCKTDEERKEAFAAWMIERLKERGDPEALELIEEFTNPMPIYAPVKPNRCFAATSKSTAALFGSLLDKSAKDRISPDDLKAGVSLSVGKTAGKNQIDIAVDLQAFLAVNDDCLPAFLGRYEREIFNAVCTLSEFGNRYITPANVYRTMTGKPTRNQSTLDRISDALDKMSLTKISLDDTAQFRYWRDTAKDSSIPVDVNVLRSVYLLPLEKCTVEHKGEKVDAYQLLKMPELYRRSKIFRQVTCYPTAVLAVPINNNERTIAIKGYLLERIERAKNKKPKERKAWDKTIDIETLCKECGINPDNRMDKKRAIEAAEKCLDFWQQQSYIRKYKIKRAGSGKTAAVTAIEIDAGIREDRNP